MTVRKTLDQMNSDDLDALHERLDRIRDAARLHRQTLIGTSELYAVIEALDAPSGPAPAQTGDDDDYCGVDPPRRADDPNTQWGDCWCTLPTSHTGQHHCQPCTDRHGAPGWTDQPKEQ